MYMVGEKNNLLLLPHTDVLMLNNFLIFCHFSSHVALFTHIYCHSSGCFIYARVCVYVCVCVYLCVRVKLRLTQPHEKWAPKSLLSSQLITDRRGVN